MASYSGHLAFSTLLGVGYTGAAVWYAEVPLVPAVFGAVLTAGSGLLPDLDSDSGVPVRTLFGVAGVAVPLLLFQRLLTFNWPLWQFALVLLGIYVGIHYVAAALFKRLTVHRGMFHSLPAMLIAGLAVFLLYHDTDVLMRFFFACGTMLGFLSHLVLDEMCSVNLVGAHLHLNKYAGSAVKLHSSSWSANLVAYGLLAYLVVLALPDIRGSQEDWRNLRAGTYQRRALKAERPVSPSLLR